MKLIVYDIWTPQRKIHYIIMKKTKFIKLKIYNFWKKHTNRPTSKLNEYHINPDDIWNIYGKGNIKPFDGVLSRVVLNFKFMRHNLCIFALLHVYMKIYSVYGKWKRKY